MRKWKDEGSHIIKPFQRKIYLIIGCLIILRPVVFFVLFRQLDVLDIMNIVLGSFLIWGIQLNGFYKIIRWYAERQMKRWDNKWR